MDIKNTVQVAGLLPFAGTGKNECLPNRRESSVAPYAISSRARNGERMVPQGYTLRAEDVRWIKSLAEVLGCSDSQILRGVVARAREMDAEIARGENE